MPWAAVVPAAISAAGSIGGALLSRGGGGSAGSGAASAPIPRYIWTPSFSFENHPEDGTVTTNLTGPALTSLNRVKDITSGAAGQLGALLPQVQPGFGRLTDTTRQVFGAARQRLADARLAATSDLRGNLEKRRVLGSSFATDAMARAESEFARADQELTAQENQTQAANFLAELDQTTNLINQQASMDLKGLLTELDQLNFTSAQSTQLVSSAQSAITQNASLQADLAARSAAGNGALSGLLLGQGLSTLRGTLPSLLSGGGGSGSGADPVSLLASLAQSSGGAVSAN